LLAYVALVFIFETFFFKVVFPSLPFPSFAHEYYEILGGWATNIPRRFSQLFKKSKPECVAINTVIVTSLLKCMQYWWLTLLRYVVLICCDRMAKKLPNTGPTCWNMLCWHVAIVWPELQSSLGTIIDKYNGACSLRIDVIAGRLGSGCVCASLNRRQPSLLATLKFKGLKRASNLAILEQQGNWDFKIVEQTRVRLIKPGAYTFDCLMSQERLNGLAVSRWQPSWPKHGLAAKTVPPKSLLSRPSHVIIVFCAESQTE